MGTTLVVNPGSSSKKYGLYQNGRTVLESRFEKSEAGFDYCSQVMGTQPICESVSESDYDTALEHFVAEAEAYRKGHRMDVISTVVVRIVAPGTFFQQHREIDKSYLKELQVKEVSAPLYIPTVLREIATIQRLLPNARIIGASDSAFHNSLPSIAREFAISEADASSNDIYRFGYHGLSVASVVRRIHPLIGREPERMIVCHVGDGVSVTAVKNGKSMDTTMGYSPTSGVMMGSRVGSLEPGALLTLMRAKNLRPFEADVYINTSGGLYGVAKEADIRQLLRRRSEQDKTATKALSMLVYQLQQAIASAIIPLGGVDVLVLTATAMVRSSELRELLLTGLESLQIEFSPERNQQLIGKDGVISKRNSPVKIVVMRSDEMGEMASLPLLFTKSQPKEKLYQPQT